MENYPWQFFERTGNIEAYLTYLEYRRLTDSEFAKEQDARQADIYDRESPWYCGEGDECGRERQDTHRFD